MVSHTVHTHPLAIKASRPHTQAGWGIALTKTETWVWGGRAGLVTFQVTPRVDQGGNGHRMGHDRFEIHGPLGQVASFSMVYRKVRAGPDLVPTFFFCLVFLFLWVALQLLRG